MKNKYKYCKICFKKRLIKEFSEYKILDKTYYACYECLPPDEEPDDIPVEERKKVVETNDSRPPDVTAWPTANDITECCGVWIDTDADGMPKGNPIKITQNCLLSYLDRSEFDRNVTDMRYRYTNIAYARSGSQHGTLCDPVKNVHGKCVVGHGTQLVVFQDGTLCTVIRRCLRLNKVRNLHVRLSECRDTESYQQAMEAIDKGDFNG